jgi:hypothetical protein
MTASRRNVDNFERWSLRYGARKVSEPHNVRIATHYRVETNVDGQTSTSSPVVDKLIALPRLRGVVGSGIVWRGRA